MKKYFIFICVLTLSHQAQSQDQYPATEPMKPGMSEFWTPQPKVIAPGTNTVNAAPTAPSDAIILFDGKNLSEWRSEKGNQAEWDVHNGVVTVNKQKGDIVTHKTFGDFQLHIEWCVPVNISGTGQARGNSGIFLQDKYEVQVLDNFKNQTYINGQAASVYKQTPPLVNAMRQPGEWNVYDIIYTAPTFTENGTFRTQPTVTLIHNGIVVQNHTAIVGTTEYIGFPKVIPHQKGPIRLQAHGDPSEPISFRNIWVREL